jgi:hypothetical protein
LVFQNYIEINGSSPTTSAFTAAPGDQIIVAVKQTSAGAKVILRDATQATSQTFTRLGSGFAGSDDTADIGVSAVALNGVDVPNPVFGSVSFARAWTNGADIGTLPHTAYNEASATAGGTVRVVTSVLNTAGNWFRTTQMHTA